MTCSKNTTSGPLPKRVGLWQCSNALCRIAGNGVDSNLRRLIKHGIMQLSDNYMMEMPHMLDPRQIHSLTDFLRHHKAHLARLKETKTPEVLTVNGRAEVVIQDRKSVVEGKGV